MNVRHPMSRLLSAYRDKFRKGHPWMRIVEPKFGKFLQKLETKDMSLEVTFPRSFFHLNHKILTRENFKSSKNIQPFYVLN